MIWGRAFLLFFLIKKITLQHPNKIEHSLTFNKKLLTNVWK